MLEEILEAKKKRLESQKTQLSLDVLKNRCSLMPAVRNFRQALLGEDISVIAEIKKASPSLGDIAPDLDIAKTAVSYEEGGASAISVLTEEDYFKGEPSFIKSVKEAIRIPVLRKDFIFEEYQIYESKYLAADAVLLIATILEKKVLRELVDISILLNIEPLVEVHTQEDIEKTLQTKARVIGINNRDLQTFDTDLKVTQRLISLVGSGKIIVSESGIKNNEDVRWLKSLGVDAILVGESIIKAEDSKEKIQSLIG